jgi:hypothetical protein
MEIFRRGVRFGLAWVFVYAIFSPAPASAQQDAIHILKSQLAEIQAQLKNALDRIEQLEREKQTAAATPAQSQPVPSETSPSSGPAAQTGKGVSSAFNPAISVNGLFLGGYSSNARRTRRLTGLDFNNGFNLQEAEVQFTADVDPYWKANLIVAVDREGSVGVEEGYVTSEELPYGWLPANTSIKLGKFVAAFGKHNLLHAHQFPFINQPLISQTAFGDEGLREPGLGVSYLLPSSWFSELTFQGFAGENEALFRLTDEKRRGAYLGHWKNFFDLSDETTLEAGASVLGGRNSNSASSWSKAVGVDLTTKWRSSPERALVWQAEYIYFDRDRDRVSAPRGGGLYSSLQYQFARRWWLQGRYDLLGVPKLDDETRKHRWSTLLAFIFSEFSAVRLQHSITAPARRGPLNEILLQFNFTIGSHPAHQY